MIIFAWGNIYLIVDFASVKQILNTNGTDSINNNILGKQPIKNLYT